MQRRMRLELSDLDAVDRRPILADIADFVLGHFLYPDHAMPLQAGSRQIDRRVGEWPVEITSPDEHEVDEVAREAAGAMPIEKA